MGMKYLLDTNTCVQYLRKGSTSLIAAKLSSLPAGDVMLCTVVLGELLFGALRSRDVVKNRADVRKFAAAFAALDFDSSAAESYATIRADLAAKGTPIGPNDLLIAAIALTQRLTVVTHNTAEFSRVAGLTLEDWQTP
jgi:tRNA(fMet)-specific endonuclease VapC